MGEQDLSIVFAADDCGVGITPVEHVFEFKLLASAAGIAGVRATLDLGSKSSKCVQCGEPILNSRSSPYLIDFIARA